MTARVVNLGLHTKFSDLNFPKVQQNQHIYGDRRFKERQQQKNIWSFSKINTGEKAVKSFDLPEKSTKRVDGIISKAS